MALQPTPQSGPPVSLRRRLLLQLLLLAACLSVGLYAAVRLGADRASEATFDAVLGAAAGSLAEEVRVAEGGIAVDLPPATFSMLSAMGEERIFYRVDVDGVPVTGYADLPLPEQLPTALAPSFYDARYRETDIRVAAILRSIRIEGRAAPLLVLLAETRQGQGAIAARLGNRAAVLGLAIFLAAIPFSLYFARSFLSPIDRLAEAVGRRGPRDLRPLRHPAPSELQPFVTALNSFIARLRSTLSQTETFLAEAAHHIRTPLTVMRNEAELALRQSGEEETRARLRGLIRAADESARSASQLLDHATVLYRAEQADWAEMDLARLVGDLVERFRPAAEMRDISIRIEARVALPTRSDPVLVEAALRNIIDNAVKYSAPDGLVDVLAEAAAGEARVTVMDRGRGLAGVVEQGLKRRFRRGANVSDVPGSGLGLTIVEEAAQAMGGSFAIGPREGGGTCAVFSLPLL